MFLSPAGDWIQSTPDRNTGLWDIATTEVTGNVVIINPFVRTHNITVGASPTAIVSAKASVLNRGTAEVSGRLRFGIEGQPSITVAVKIPAGESVDDVELGPLALRNIELWWPHTHGVPALHTASFTFEQQADSETPVSITSQLHTRVGVRTVETTIDTVTQGRMFYLNGKRIFIEGGNWIATDQFQRFAGDRGRYFNEVKMHQQMGIDGQLNAPREKILEFTMRHCLQETQFHQQLCRQDSI